MRKDSNHQPTNLANENARVAVAITVQMIHLMIFVSSALILAKSDPSTELILALSDPSTA